MTYTSLLSITLTVPAASLLLMNKYAVDLEKLLELLARLKEKNN